MSTIIRATDHNRDTQVEAFNFDDIAARADTYLAGVRSRAQGLVAEAQRQADEIRSQARQEGYQAGMAAVEELVGKRLTTVMPALGQVIGDIQHAKQAWLTHWEASAVHVATAIAERLIRRELPRHPEIAITMIREALELAAGNSQLRIHLNPEDHEAMGDQVKTLIEELSPLAEVELIPNADVTTGGCRVETRFGTIDQRFESQLKRIEEELT